jgi:hypothetical protein
VRFRTENRKFGPQTGGQVSEKVRIRFVERRRSIERGLQITSVTAAARRERHAPRMVTHTGGPCTITLLTATQIAKEDVVLILVQTVTSFSAESIHSRQSYTLFVI